MTSVCERCGTSRERLIDYRGFLISTNYNYVDGYLSQGAADWTGRDGRADLRLVSLMRILDEGELPETVASRSERRATRASSRQD